MLQISVNLSYPDCTKLSICRRTALAAKLYTWLQSEKKKIMNRWERIQIKNLNFLAHFINLSMRSPKIQINGEKPKIDDLTFENILLNLQSIVFDQQMNYCWPINSTQAKETWIKNIFSRTLFYISSENLYKYHFSKYHHVRLLGNDQAQMLDNEPQNSGL